MREFSHIFNVIDNSLQPVRAHKNGARGFINLSIHAYPPHELHVWDLLEAERYDEAHAEFERVTRPIRAFQTKCAQRSGGYRVAKGLMAAVGRPAGPPRPPTLPLNDEEMTELRAIVSGFGWPAVEQTEPAGAAR
jgi:dihydrodipicolinate synthase/N-acetylneuraminate lyase